MSNRNALSDGIAPSRRTVTRVLALAALVLAYPASVRAQLTPEDLVDGEVRRVDRNAGKITVRHGPLPNLDMPAMTMVFQVADASLLGTLKEGDKGKFLITKSGGQFTLKGFTPSDAK